MAMCRPRVCWSARYRRGSARFSGLGARMFTVTIQVDIADDDMRDHDRLSRALKRELALLDVEDVVFARNHQPPDGAKGGAGPAGEIIVSLANSAAITAALTGVCQVLKSWVKRGEGRKIVLKDGDRTLEITGSRAHLQDHAIEAFLNRISQNDEERQSKLDR